MPAFSVSGADVPPMTPLSSPAMSRPMLTIVTHKTAKETDRSSEAAPATW